MSGLKVKKIESILQDGITKDLRVFCATWNMVTRKFNSISFQMGALLFYVLNIGGWYERGALI